MSSKPWLLYAYPWMPFPRRVTIYLREKGIPTTLITVVPVSTTPPVNVTAPGFPPRPEGSLPILAIPPVEPSGKGEWIYIRQSLAIMSYIDELCDAGEQGFPESKYPMRGADALGRARVAELMCLADECMIAWNPVRFFGTGAGTMSVPAASKEMIRWVYRGLATIEKWFKDRDFSGLRQGGNEGPNMAEVVLYQFLEFTKDCYGKDMTLGSGKPMVKDVYGKESTETFPKLGQFYEAFKTRDSAKGDPAKGDVAGEEALKAMQTWAEGST